MLLSRNKTKLRYIIGIINNIEAYMLITADYFRLSTILKKMVAANQITTNEREELLHKSGLIKQEDGRWKDVPADPRSGNYPSYLTLD